MNDSLKTVLLWIIGGGGSAAVTFFLFENVAKLAALDPKPKRFASLGVSALLAMSAFSVAVAMTYLPTPLDWRAWLESLFAVAFVAVGGSQWIHGAYRLAR